MKSPWKPVVAGALLSFAMASAAAQQGSPQIVIGHRGASGYVPEHTLAAYRLAIEQGADFIEPDLVMTRDGVLVARHENEIGGTTDVAGKAGFASRKTTKIIDGVQVSGWFTEDFTLAELKTLRAKERIPKLRPANTRFDGQHEIPTLEEVLLLLENQSRKIGVYPETKHPSYFQGIGLAMEAPLVALLERYGYRGRDAAVFIQSFESGNLRQLAKMTELPLIQLLSDGKPFDLADIATYARGIGPNKNLIIPLTAGGSLGTPTSLVRDAHAKGLLVHPWTFRAENNFLPRDLRSGADPAAAGDLAGELRRFLDLGIDGFFTDQPDQGVRARQRSGDRKVP